MTMMVVRVTKVALLAMSVVAMSVVARWQGSKVAPSSFANTKPAFPKGPPSLLQPSSTFALYARVVCSSCINVCFLLGS